MNCKIILHSAIAAACAFLAGCATPALRAATTPDDFIAVTNSSLSRDEVNARELPYWADSERGLFYFQTLKPQQRKGDAIQTVETPIAVATTLAEKNAALQIWRAPDSTVSQRCVAATLLLKPGMTYAKVKEALGEPTQSFRDHGMMIRQEEEESEDYESWGLEYRFPDGGVHLHMDGWQDSPHPEQWTFKHASYVGVSQPSVVRTNADDEIDVKIENVPVSASHPSYREWLQQRRHTSRFREDGDQDDELNGLALPVRIVEVEEIVEKGITPPPEQDAREKALIDDTQSTLGQTLINDAK